jgi:hypothetical protein
MFDDVLHITEAFNAYFPQLHGAVRDDFFKGVEILVWAEALRDPTFFPTTGRMNSNGRVSDCRGAGQAP